MSHINIPIFVPHLGCPHTCVFCNQRSITGKKEFSTDCIDTTVSKILSSVDPSKHSLQIAFFGGSFTAIERELMLALLDQAERYVQEGKIDSIRLSTRPDAVNHEILSLLSHYSVKVIELGIQSTDDTVLAASERGHTAAQSQEACRLVKEYGFSLVGQMMLGLPRSSLESEVKTAQDMVSWKIDQARIYPTVVFSGTVLEDKMKSGEYIPLSVEDAVERAAAVYRHLSENQVEIIRIGLCETDGLRNSDTVVGGAYHPAIGELVINRHYLTKIMTVTDTLSIPESATLIIETASHALSQAIGQKKCNLRHLEKIYPRRKILFRPSPTLIGNEVKILVKEN